jgi:hypothetical protein
MEMPDNWDAGTFTVKVQTTHDNAVPADNLNADVAVQCRGDDEVINNTFGSEIAADIATYATQWDLREVETAAITPNCTTSCLAGDRCYFRWQMDAAGTTTAVANLHILGFTVGYTIVDVDEVD